MIQQAMEILYLDHIELFNVGQTSLQSLFSYSQICLIIAFSFLEISRFSAAKKKCIFCVQ